MRSFLSFAVMLAAIFAPICAAFARTVAGFEVPYTFNPIRTGPGWNDSDVWVVTLISPKDGEAACLASHHDRDSNVTPVIVNGFSGGGEAMQIGVNIAFKRDEGQELSPTPAVLRFFQNGVALDTLQGNVSTSDNSEMWIAVISRAQLYDLLRKASDDRISVDLSANNGWSANISNLITSPDYLFGEIYPDQANIANRERNDFTECRRRAKIIGEAQSPSPNATKLPPVDRFHRDELRVYCASAGDTTPAVFGGGRTGLPIEWRCVKGAVYICEAGADGVACGARSHSRVPLPSMVEACRSHGRLSVADGAYSTVWRWECRDGKPFIAGPQETYDPQTKTTMPVEFDAQGYVKDEWTPLQ